ncbi:MAG TPA: hypothetical protein VF515_05570 [Candidatus Binatia bacterium]
MPNNTSCNDGTACTTNDVCQAGTCAGTALVCTASDQCHVAGTCDTGTGQCSNPAKPDNTACNDGTACTTNDVCTTGTCAGTPLVCTASDQCHVAGTCDTGTGQCSNPPAADNTPCNDGNACTTGDACQAGACVSGTVDPLCIGCTTNADCTALDQCHLAGTCQADGTCSNPPAADNTPCSDGTACTTNDVCTAGTCAGTPLVCTASDQCHVAGTCDTGTGQCSNPPAPNGTLCQAPRIIGGATGGSTVITVSGVGGPGCVPGPIQVFDCGPDRLCHDFPDDFPLPVLSAIKLPNGDFVVTLAQPLVPGQQIYVTDGCTYPLLSVPALVRGLASVPTLSGSMLVALEALLALVGLLGLSRIGPFARRG